MRFLVAAAALLLAGCATSEPIAIPARVATSVVPDPVERGALIGADAGTLASRFGAPRLTVREGDGTKLQFAGGSCLLDAYLYPGNDRVARVTHIDTRNREGRTVAQDDCIAMIERR